MLAKVEFVHRNEATLRGYDHEGNYVGEGTVHLLQTGLTSQEFKAKYARGTLHPVSAIKVVSLLVNWGDDGPPDDIELNEMGMLNAVQLEFSPTKSSDAETCGGEAN